MSYSLFCDHIRIQLILYLINNLENIFVFLDCFNCDNFLHIVSEVATRKILFRETISLKNPLSMRRWLISQPFLIIQSFRGVTVTWHYDSPWKNSQKNINCINWIKGAGSFKGRIILVLQLSAIVCINAEILHIYMVDKTKVDTEIRKLSRIL